MRFKLRNAFIGGVAYLYLVAILMGLCQTGDGVALVIVIVIVIYVIACMLTTKSMITGAEGRKSANSIEFYQSGAADSIGIPYGSFHHVFDSNESVLEAYKAALSDALKSKLGCSELREAYFKDVDKGAGTSEKRTFYVSVATETLRKSAFMLLCQFTHAKAVQGVRWWMLVIGARDPNKVFWRYCFAPLAIPFQIIPYIKRQYDPLSGLQTIYPGFFNGIDVWSRTREIEYIAFETLIEVLDAHGIDTSTLKLQKSNILNVNISGGQASFGSVVQGKMNNVRGAVGGPLL